VVVSLEKYESDWNLNGRLEASAGPDGQAKPDPSIVWTSLRCRECGINEFTLPLGTRVTSPACFTCRVCNGHKSILDKLSWNEIARTSVARRLFRERVGRLAFKRKADRERKFYKRNGFTLDEWRKRIDTLGWVCSFCGCELTKELKEENTAVRWSMDGSNALDKTFPVCRACQCKKIGPLGKPEL